MKNKPTPVQGETCANQFCEDGKHPLFENGKITSFEWCPLDAKRLERDQALVLLKAEYDKIKSQSAAPIAANIAAMPEGAGEGNIMSTIEGRAIASAACRSLTNKGDIAKLMVQFTLEEIGRAHPSDAAQVTPVEIERILCAANWYPNLEFSSDKRPPQLIYYLPVNVDKGVVFCAHRHLQCVWQMIMIFGLRQAEAGEERSGFLTNTNRWVDRNEAAIIAKNANQLLHPSTYLFSEDIY